MKSDCSKVKLQDHFCAWVDFIITFCCCVPCTIQLSNEFDKLSN
jgi:hypothetical protein